VNYSSREGTERSTPFTRKKRGDYRVRTSSGQRCMYCPASEHHFPAAVLCSPVPHVMFLA
jgi:hypothetical protein